MHHRGEEKEKKMVVRFIQIMTVPHCYPSVVLNTLEISIKVCIGVEVKFIVTGEGTRAVMRGSAEVNMTPRTEVTMIVTGITATAMVLDTVIKTMGGMSGGVSLIDVREAMCARRGNMDMGTMRGSRSRDRRKSRTGSNTRTSRWGVTLTLFMTPFSAIVTSAVKGRPEKLGRVRCLRTRV